MNADIQMRPWGEVTDEIQHESRSIEQAMESALKGAIDKALHKSYLQNKDFYLHLWLRVLMTPEAVHEDMPMYVVPVPFHGTNLYALCRFRESAPTPSYDESVFKYHRNAGSLEFLWHLPVKGSVEEYVKNYSKYMNDPHHKRQADMCMLYHSGQLLDWVKKENNEDPRQEGLTLKYHETSEKAQASIIH